MNLISMIKLGTMKRMVSHAASLMQQGQSKKTCLATQHTKVGQYLRRVKFLMDSWIDSAQNI